MGFGQGEMGSAGVRTERKWGTRELTRKLSRQKRGNTTVMDKNVELIICEHNTNIFDPGRLDRHIAKLKN
jgi:hypothetical protein